MKTLKWTNERRKVKDLLPADYNPRRMTDKQRQELKESIQEFDTVEPIIINIGKRNNTLIGGHQRTTLYADIGIEEIDVRVPSRELTLTEEKRLNLRLNKNVGEWDPEKLMEMDLTTLLDVGFDDDDLSAFWDDVEIIDDEFNVEKAIKEIKVPKTKKGDLYQLGKHKLLCGDSTKEEDVKKLMGEELADMIYTDPPYNIGLDYSKGVSTTGKYDGAYTGKKDSKKDADYAGFLDATMKNAISHARPNFHMFYWCDEKYIWLLQSLFQDNKVDNKRVCMWVKNNFNMTPQIAFNKVYEPCVYGIRGKPYLNKAHKNLNEIMNKEVESGNQVHDEILDMLTVWLVKRDNAQDYEHPTQKPITLNEKPIKRCSAPGHIILDLFGGSGSTLIACEQAGRKAYLMEQDPIFCDVIVKRFEEFTNEKAKKIS